VALTSITAVVDGIKEVLKTSGCVDSQDISVEVRDESHDS